MPRKPSKKSKPIPPPHAYKSAGGPSRFSKGWAPAVDREKLDTRIAAIANLTDGTVLETNAGKGYLSLHYAYHASKLIMVDKNKQYLQTNLKQLQQLNVKCAFEAHCQDNMTFLKQKLSTVKDIALVDIDPFGDSNLLIKAFFDNYEVSKPLIVTITDGSVIFAVKRLAEQTLELAAQAHNLKITTIKADEPKAQKAFYGAYLLQPENFNLEVKKPSPELSQFHLQLWREQQGGVTEILEETKPPLDFGELPDGSTSSYLQFYRKLFSLFGERKIDHKELNSLAFTADRMASLTKQPMQIIQQTTVIQPDREKVLGSLSEDEQIVLARAINRLDKQTNPSEA